MDARPRRARNGGGRGVIDPATIAPLRTLAERVLALADVDAACALLFAQGRTPNEVARELSTICAPGGEAERIADALESPEIARETQRRLADTFAPFAEILRAISATGRNERWKYGKTGYTRTTTAEAIRAEAERRKKEQQRRAKYVATFAEAAEELGVKREVVRTYAQKGTLVGVYPDGKRKAVGVTRQSLEAYTQKQEMRKAATLAKAQAKADRKAEKAEYGGIFYTEDGRKIHGAERVSSVEACEIFSRGRSQIAAWANARKIERVYIDPNRRHAVGYLRESVERYAAEREAIIAAGGVYFTTAGQIVGAERISREEAAKRLHVHILTVTALWRRGELEHVYADADCLVACGYTLQSVEAYAQAHPRHIPAKRAEAIDNFKIQILPPQPRRHGLRAARLDPDTESETGQTPTTTRRKREKPRFIFRLALAAWNPAELPDDPNTERTPEMAEQENTGNGEQGTATTGGAKLQIAKAYTVHEDGTIRAICVSEEDRDEIVAALALYRKAKAAPGEIEAALALYRTIKGMMGATAPAAGN